MQREVPIWLAVVIVVVIVVLVGLIYYLRQRQPSVPPEVQKAIEAGKVPPIRRVPQQR